MDNDILIEEPDMTYEQYIDELLIYNNEWEGANEWSQR